MPHRRSTEFDDSSRTHALVPIDYKSLGVRQLGSIYEGLLEFRLRIADQRMAIVRGKRTEEIVPYRQAVKEKLQLLTVGRSRGAAERTIVKGEVYLANERQERKATGSYYTPDHIVTYIVEQAVGPVLQDHLESLRPAFRTAQRATLGLAGLKVDQPLGDVVDRLFDFRILDPAMGSGHFLVEAVDFTTDKLLDFLNGFPQNPVQVQLQATRDAILAEMERQGVSIDHGKLTDVNLLKRYVLKRCVYGVDLNPMAVELAKVSVWLDCFTLGAPLSFLDHHLRCGNSLIGAEVAAVREAVEPAVNPDGSQQMAMFASRFAGLRLATELMHHVGELSDVTTNQVTESRAEYRRALTALAPFKRILDLYTAQWFVGSEPVSMARRGRRQRTSSDRPLLAFLKSPDSERLLNAAGEREVKAAVARLNNHDRKLAEGAMSVADAIRLFHWELEFPEAFYRRMGERVELRHEPGFDVTIGNPPYDVLAGLELGRDVSQEVDYYKGQSLYRPAIRLKNNLYKLFICRAHGLVKPKGAFSFIVPMALLGDDQSRGVRELLLDAGGLVAVEVFPQKDDPRRRVFPEAKLATTVFVSRPRHADDAFTVRTHSGRLIEESSPLLTIRPSEPKVVDPENFAIFSCTQEDWDLAVRIVKAPAMRRMHIVATQYQGEVNETTERKHGSLSTNPRDPLALRGANITLYVVREASQGDEIHVNTKAFLGRARRGEGKTLAFQEERLGFQRSAPQNNFRRLIAARIAPGFFCLDTVSYVLGSECKIPLEFLLVLLNSKILEWYFRLGSTNSKVNEYQFNSLPVPALVPGRPDSDLIGLLKAEQWEAVVARSAGLCGDPGTLPEPVLEVLVAMCRRLEALEGQRQLSRRSERAALAPESQPIQNVIDRLLFRCYGVSEEEARYVSRRLEEML